MNFQQALQINNLGQLIQEQYGQWGSFTEEAASDIWEAASKETQPYFRVTLASMLSVTIMNESVFNRFQKPNTNTATKPTNIYCPSSWDFGWCQINFFWNVLDAWEGNTLMKGLPWREVFGAPPFIADAPFNGNPVTNARACARIMLSKKSGLDASGVTESVQETQVVHYTGGNEKRKSHRRSDWRKYGHLFVEFYEAYDKRRL